MRWEAGVELMADIFQLSTYKAHCTLHSQQLRRLYEFPIWRNPTLLSECHKFFYDLL